MTSPKSEPFSHGSGGAGADASMPAAVLALFLALLVTMAIYLPVA
jgi:hypothetical protein